MALTKTASYLRRPLAIIITGGLLLGSAACSGQAAKPFTSADLDKLADNPACTETQRLEGDPNFYGAAAGLNCVRESAKGVVIRVHEDPDATEKVVSDWAELITNDNQIVYGRNWFATGPKDLLDEMFRDYEKSGPQTSIPAVASLTTEESNLSLCSSITYNVVTDSLTGTDETSLAPYFDNYPGLKQLRTDIVRTATGAGLDKTTSADAYLASIFLTRYDSQIKDFCAAFS